MSAALIRNVTLNTRLCTFTAGIRVSLYPCDVTMCCDGIDRIVLFALCTYQQLIRTYIITLPLFLFIYLIIYLFIYLILPSTSLASVYRNSMYPSTILSSHSYILFFFLLQFLSVCLYLCAGFLTNSFPSFFSSTCYFYSRERLCETVHSVGE